MMRSAGVLFTDSWDVGDVNRSTPRDGSIRRGSTKTASSFDVLMIVGGGFADARQRLPALRAETHAQLMTERSRENHLGRGRSTNWADRANLTRAANSARSVGVDSKIFRWIAEVVADGGETRSLAGHSARLAGGLSQGPGGRGAPLEE